MSLLQEQHTHPKDPLEGKQLAPSPLFSPWSNPAIVTRMVELWADHSANQISKILSAEFGIRLTRNSVVGRLHRMGLTAGDKSQISNRAPRAKRTNIPAKPSRPRLHIVRANGNSERLKVVQSVERDLPELRCVKVDPLNIPLLDLTPTSCRYVTQDAPDWRFCGHVNRAASSYCVAHHRLVWMPATPRNQTARGWK